MGQCASKKNFEDGIDFDTTAGLLPIEGLKCSNLGIENLIFGDGGAKAFAYVGALKVLERLHILKKIRRFVGVGSGSLIAATLAIGLKIRTVQVFFQECLETLDLQDYVKKNKHRMLIDSQYGILSGENLIYRFEDLLKSHSFSVDLTFGELYKRTGRELCLIVSNVNYKTIEYFHPKTTPDFRIANALLMSLCIPGIFSPYKHDFGQDECYYLSGNLICSYPLSVYDGPWLSMEQGNDLPPKKPTSRRLYRSDSLGMKNEKSLGLIAFDKLQESNYPELRDRLSKYQADTSTPRTLLGVKYQESLEKLQKRERQYLLVREGGFKIMRLAGEIDRDILREREFAHMIMTRDSITREEINAVFCAEINTEAECAHALKKMNKFYDELHKSDLSARIEELILSKLREHYGSDRTTVTSLHTFFGALTNTAQSSTFELGKDDFERTIGILSKYVCCYNAALEDDDLRYLYKQGWNATVAYVLHKKDQQRRTAYLERTTSETATTSL